MGVDDDAALFDLSCTLFVSKTDQTRSITVSFNASLDLFEKKGLIKTTHRFVRLLSQLFLSDQPLYTFSLFLDEEREILRKLNDTHVDYGPIRCAHHHFIKHAQQYPQKLAMVFEDQSITYTETLFYAQQVAFDLVTEYQVCPNDVVVQLMERSIELVIGILAIWMSGATYAPINPHDPIARLMTCMEQTNAKHIMFHSSTSHISVSSYSNIRINDIINDMTERDLIEILSSIPVSPEHISHIVFTSGSTGKPKAVREALSINSVLDFAQFAHDKCQFYNWYGPAECTEAASKYLISGNELKQGHLPIGRPIPNVHIYIVDDYLQHVIPDIQIGDIVIGGSGVFAGYTDDLLTHQALIDIDGKLCYRTGDLGRLNIESGQIEFKGRRDYQVKLRGQRIELTEVENTILEATDWVQNCVVVIQIDEESVSSLVAHIMVKSEDDRLRENVIDYCRQHLPFYMVPSMWSFVDRLPINDNGKIDRKRLPRVSRNRHQDEVITPGTELEEQLQLIFSQVFHIPLDDVDVTLSFELLGGTSLGIIHALSMIRNQIYEGVDAHTFEQRVFQLAPVTVGPGSIIEANSFVFPGAILEGENMIEPLTLIMKGDHLDKGTR
ncbi:unnamed protein product, partial [Rotaria sp. Silwood1]